MSYRFILIFLLNLSSLEQFLPQTARFSPETIPFSSDYSCKCLPGIFPGLGEDESRYIHKKQCEYSMIYKSLRDTTKIMIEFLQKDFSSKKICSARLASYKKSLCEGDSSLQFLSILREKSFDTDSTLIVSMIEKIYKDLDPEVIFASTKESHSTTLDAEKIILSKAFLNLKSYTEFLCKFFEHLMYELVDQAKKAEGTLCSFNYKDGLARVVNELYTYLATHLSSAGEGSFFERFFKFFEVLNSQSQGHCDVVSVS